MFERLMLHGAAIARRAAEGRRSSLAEALGEEAPGGVKVSEEENGVALEGRGLGRRFAFDSELRWRLAGRRR